MITQDILKWALLDIGASTIDQVMEGDKDYILLETHTFNVGSYATLEEHDYDEEVEQEAADNGMLFCDKDSFQGILETISYS